MWHLVLACMASFGAKEGIPVAMGDYCTQQPPSALVRQSGWVDVRSAYVLKHVRPRQVYNREKSITLLLGKYPQFASLLNYNDNCQILNITRLHQTHNKVCMDEDKERQVNYIFSVLEMLGIGPSTELYYGFNNNILVDDKGLVTVYDFGNYMYNAQPGYIRQVRDKLLGELYKIYRCPLKIV